MKDLSNNDRLWQRRKDIGTIVIGPTRMTYAGVSSIKYIQKLLNREISHVGR